MSARRRSIFESLETRRLLSAAAEPLAVETPNVVEVQWRNATAPVYAGQWVVQLGGYKGTQGSQIQKARRLLGEAEPRLEVSQFLLKNGQFTVELPSNWSMQKQYNALKAMPGFVAADPNWVLTTNATPNDPQYGSLWGLNTAGDTDIDAPEGWNITTGSMDQIVGIIDSGVDYNHVDLYQNIYLNQQEIPLSRRANLVDIDGDGLITFRDLNNAANQGPFKIVDQNSDGRITGADLRVAMGQTGGVDNGTGGWADGVDTDANFLVDDFVGWNFLSGNNDPGDVFGHGTHVAGTVGATGNNSVGVVGVNWKVRLLPLKTGGLTSSDNTISSAAAIASLNYAVSLKQRGEAVAATNNSWGGGGFSDVLLGAIEANAGSDITFVAASGNNGSNNDASPFYPASYTTDNVISVANLTQSGGRNFGSNYGLTSVDLGAPGTSILSTTPGNNYSFFTGTSMAAPHVAGVVAMMKALSPTLSVSQIRAAMFANVDAVAGLNGLSVTGGRVNLNKSLLSISLTPAGAPSLAASSDTGFSNNDNITQIATPTFTGTASPNRTVQIRANGNIVGTGVADANGTYSITSTALANGVYTVTATVTDGQAVSAPSPAVSVRIDTVAPVASNGGFPFSAIPQRLTVAFNEPMATAFVPSQVTLRNLTTDEVIPSSAMSVVYNTPTNIAEVRFPGLPGEVVPDGNFRVEILATDAAGNTMAAPYTFTFFILYGDADRDRDVDIADFSNLASNFNLSNKSFAQGDFDYNGIVNIADFAVLAQRFNQTLPPAAGSEPEGGRPAPSAAVSPFAGSTRISVDEEDPSLVDALPA